MEIQLRKSHRGQAQLAHLRPEPARIENFRFERQAFELPLPVALLHDATDVHFVARPINAALGEDEGIELIARDVLDPVDVEARKIELPIGARVGHEGDVVAEPRDEGDRRVSRGSVCLTTES